MRLVLLQCLLVMQWKYVNSFARSSSMMIRRRQPLVSLSMSTEESAAGSLKRSLIQLMSTTERGTRDTNRAQIFQVIDDLSRTGMPISISDMLGEWELLYSDDDVTRASPFFWAFRKALSGIEDPLKIVGPKLLSESIFKITDSIPLKSIGTAMQIFDEDPSMGGQGLLKSRIVVKVNPGNFQSVMATTSKWRTTDEPTLLELEVQKTEVLESTLMSKVGRFVPKGLKSMVSSTLDGFPSGAALELVKPGSSTVYMRIVYQDSTLRIVRNEADGKTFIFGRVL